MVPVECLNKWQREGVYFIEAVTVGCFERAIWEKNLPVERLRSVL
jgi:hypothetical protein